MRSLLNCVFTASLLAATCFTFSNQAIGQDLQWQHASRKQPRAKSQVQPAASVPAASATQQRQNTAAPVAKRPAVRKPKQFKQPTGASQLPTGAQASQRGASAQSGSSAAQAAEMAARQRAATSSPATAPAMASRPRAASGQQTQRSRTVGSRSMVDQVLPTQWEEPMIGGCECGNAGCGCCDSSYGEVGCGFPEPGCSCGPGGCGDGCFIGEPGCGFAYGDQYAGEVTCGCGDVGCVGCGDGVACGSAWGEPTCGCGGNGCNDCRNWPESLFGCSERGCVPILWVPPIREIVAFGGVQGFKGPLDGNRDGGNFGFHQGFNIGGEMAWLPWPGLGYQFGYRATQNQLNGDTDSAVTDGHSQSFITTGLFRRRRIGLQYGVVWDMLRDERQGARDFGQVRGEVSFRNVANRELGFAFTANSNNDQIGGNTFQATDQYLLFYRMGGNQGGEVRAFAGFDSKSSAIIGSDFHVPLTNRFSLEGDWTYLNPDNGAAQDEAWNLSMQLVWHYGARGKSWHQRPFRPMFNVANNGSLIVTD